MWYIYNQEDIEATKKSKTLSLYVLTNFIPIQRLTFLWLGGCPVLWGCCCPVLWGCVVLFSGVVVVLFSGVVVVLFSGVVVVAFFIGWTVAREGDKRVK